AAKTSRVQTLSTSIRFVAPGHQNLQMLSQPSQQSMEFRLLFRTESTQDPSDLVFVHGQDAVNQLSAFLGQGDELGALIDSRLIANHQTRPLEPVHGAGNARRTDEKPVA